MVLHVFPLAPSSSNTVNTVEGNGDRGEGKKLACF